ncbi:MAG: methylenetetrahydrofolate--tRNA-(uracil(54)-C(5))-methyltransferase (FADH(2)-oxidizing) TrmFO [Hyphomicrobiaceae bacterium]|nr:methylenetetrahydrofolate--tRNA-(uracil(54)-C(5))-methyltransferase (FADH(2)-oxidizing) TrmFO [Hyphomicrobiaceae bacterium]
MCDGQPILHIVGGGLAGSEAAWQAANAGVRVVLHEMRPHRSSPAHVTDHLAELVCSNSFRSDDAEHNAVGLLHEEMRRCGSLIMQAADMTSLPAGGALAVDRVGFSQQVADALESHANVSIAREEVAGLPPAEWQHVIVATGPLTSEPLAKAIQTLTGEDELAFFDAIAPIVHYESIDHSVVWAQSRYDKPGPSGTGADYLNCPLSKAEYDRFIDALIESEQHQFHEWENVPYFDGCMPIEEMARRGRETPRFGPMKPVGLTNPHKPDDQPYAVVQLRQDNKLGTLWNIVGFQTKMKYGAQAEILRLIPGLEKATFARLGGLHHNTFLNSPKVLTNDLKLRADPRIRFAGQITGVEGYVESAAIGLMAGRLAAAEILGLDLPLPADTTAHGALIAHITGGHVADENAKLRSFQPMNVNFGLFPEIEVRKPEGVTRFKKVDRNRLKKELTSARALQAISDWNAEWLAKAG